MTVELVEARRRSQIRDFVALPARLHRGHRGWVPPLRTEELRFLDPEKNLAHAYCTHVPVLAYRDGRAVGRIVGIVNHRYNRLRGERSARFGQLECVEDREIAHALLEYVEHWARDLEMTRIVGPMGFTDQDPEGFLVEGFDEEPALASNQNPEYLVRFLEAEGYAKEVDYVVYRVPVPEVTPTFYRRISARTTARGTCSLVEFTSRRALEPYIRPMLELMNETFRDLIGYSSLDDAEVADLARRFLPIIDPRFVKVAVAGAEVVGFIIGVPNFNEGLRKARGRLLPFGWLEILRAAKRSQRLDLLLGGISEPYRGRGVDVLLGKAMIDSAREAGFTHLDSHHELESNHRMRREMERMGGTVYKRYRIFSKPL
jgi:GNAT superfamily N-acetyltransferase